MKITFLVLMVFLTAAIKAQELNCQVSIITEAKLEVNSTEQEALTQLKQTVIDLMNNTQWTKDKFKINSCCSYSSEQSGGFNRIFMGRNQSSY